MAQNDQKTVFERAPYVDLVVGPGQLHQIPDLLEKIRRRRSGQQLEVSLGRKDGSRDDVERSLESFDPLRDPAMRPTPLPGVRADHDRLRQVLHLLHRAERPRAGAKPPAATDRRRSSRNWPTKAAERSRCSARPSTATATAKASARRG